MSIELKKDCDFSLLVPTSMGVRITPVNSQPVHCSDTFKMQATSAESNVASVSAFLGMRVKVLTTFVKDSPIARFLAKNGPGLHHVAYRVEDLPATLAALSAAGVRLIDQTPRDGAHGMKIAFVHPKSTDGVLTEFCQPA